MIARTPQRPGMSLIEVLLGLAIFLLAIVAIGHLVDIGSDNALEASVQADGTRLAQSKLAEVEAGVIAITGGTGTFDTEPNWKWSVESAQSTAPNLYSVTVHTTFNLKGRDLTVTLAQMILDPQQMGTAAPIPKPTTTTGTATTGTSP